MQYKAKKQFWQNFLQNDEILNKISSFVCIENQNIIEIGPWLGALTKKIINKKPDNFLTLELDTEIIPVLQKNIKQDLESNNSVNFEIKNINVLKYSPEFKKYNILANIPYYITSPILTHFLYTVENKPSQMVILMQKDVWDKILKSNKNKHSVISLMIEKKATVSEKLFVGPENFRPAPKVDSSVLLFELEDKFPELNDEIFLSFIKKAFLAPRKKLIKNLTSSWIEKQKILDIFNKLNIEENTRWEDLELIDFVNIIKSLKL